MRFLINNKTIKYGWYLTHIHLVQHRSKNDQHNERLDGNYQMVTKGETCFPNHLKRTPHLLILLGQSHTSYSMLSIQVLIGYHLLCTHGLVNQISWLQKDLNNTAERRVKMMSDFATIITTDPNSELGFYKQWNSTLGKNLTVS